MSLFTLIIFALALNIDAISVGTSYGLRRIKLPFSSMLIMCSLSMTAITVSMLAGHLLAKIISPAFTKHLGGLILLLIGLFAVYKYFNEREKSPCGYTGESKIFPGQLNKPITLFQFQIFGILIQVLKKPQVADVDLSGTVSGWEAFLLGMALALDSLGAGMAISLLGYNILNTVLLVGLSQLLSTSLGLFMGKNLSRCSWGQQLEVLPGIILIVLGIIKF